MAVNRIAFRTDATSQMGTGHFMRCLTLADALKLRGAQIRFVSRNLPVHLSEMLAEKGMELVALSGNGGVSQGGDLAHSYWLGGSQTEDAQATSQALSGQEWDWLVVDHYALDARWESRLRGAAGKIMVIDDIADRAHDCDVLLDQNYESIERYKNLVPEGCHLLLGPHYALLRPEYAEHRRFCMKRNGAPQRVLIFFGGADDANMTGRALAALSQEGLSHLAVDIVVGAYYKYRDDLDQQAILRRNTIIHGPRPHLADLMARADLAIGAGGVTNWERMCVGLPSLVVTMAENQVPISRLMDSAGAIRLLGSSKDVTVENIQSALVDEIETNKYLHRSEIALMKCDGQGTNRVVSVLMSLDASPY